MAKVYDTYEVEAENPVTASRIAKTMFGNTWIDYWGDENEFDSVDMISVEEVNG
jgi:hypothetical protein